MMISGDNNNFMSEINVTPLVDVMLVLLIIFMVTAPMIIQGENVSLPQTTSGPLSAEEDNLILSIDSQSQLFINDYRVEIDFLQEKLKEILKNKKDQSVYLRADKDVPYGTVVNVMSKIKGAGVDKLGMVTEPIEEDK